MNDLRTYGELRETVVKRGWNYFDVLLPEDDGIDNPEARFVVNPLDDGCVAVTVTERNDVVYDRVFADERATVAALNAKMTPNLPVGPPPTEEELQRSMGELEAMRQEMVAKLPPERRRQLGF